MVARILVWLQEKENRSDGCPCVHFAFEVAQNVFLGEMKSPGIFTAKCLLIKQ